MSDDLDYDAVMDGVLERDRRYARPAYLFVQRALHYYREKHRSGSGSPHLKGQELLFGVRELALEEFGPMARTVLNDWGVAAGEDVGEIVYNLIEAGLMSKTEQDRKEDFAGVMKFDESLDGEAAW